MWNCVEFNFLRWFCPVLALLGVPHEPVVYARFCGSKLQLHCPRLVACSARFVRSTWYWRIPSWRWAKSWLNLLTSPNSLASSLLFGRGVRFIHQRIMFVCMMLASRKSRTEKNDNRLQYWLAIWADTPWARLARSNKWIYIYIYLYIYAWYHSICRCAIWECQF